MAIAPTANAAFIIGGRTIDSALALDGSNYFYKKLAAERESDLKYFYEDVSALFIDEISMVGSGKLAKIHFRLQDLAEGKNKNKFMGFKSCIVTGDMFQLPPVKDKYVFSHAKLDQRPQCAPSHWDENFTIYYLTEKMRSKGDNKFGEVCDRIGRGEITDDDETYLKSLVRKSPNEDDNDMFKEGKMSIIVTTNFKREQINDSKLRKLLPQEQEYIQESMDKCTNFENAPKPPQDLPDTKARGLPNKITLKEGAPIIITVNDKKYKEDGIVNGARGYVDSFQFEDGNETKLKIIWVVFRDKNIGNRMRREKLRLKGNHETNDQDAVPIEVTKTRIEINHGNHKYVRSPFPMILAYAVTAHKSQGDSLEEVTIDFTPDKSGKKPYIIAGSFYVAITRATKAENVYLKDFDTSYIKVEPTISEKIEAMRITRPYQFLKIYNDDCIFEEAGEMKIGFININGILDAEHHLYLNNDKNLSYLDLVVVGETKLTKMTTNEELAEKLSEFTLLQRFDAEDGQKHMGLLMLAPKNSNMSNFDPSMVKGFKDKHSQGLLYGMLKPLYLRFAFLYIRPGSGTKRQISTILKSYECNDCDIIMGDLNLNPQKPSELERINQLCSEKLEIALNEETTTDSKNQIDHILADKMLKGGIFVTSYYNFASNHKLLVARIGFRGNSLNKETLRKLNSTSVKVSNTNTESMQGVIPEGFAHVKNEPKTLDKEHVLDDKEDRLNQGQRGHLDLSSLNGNNWLTDDVINEYGNLIRRQFVDTFVFSTHFVTSLKNRGFENANRWTKGEDILKKSLVFFPIHENAHWYLISLNNTENTLQILDPYEPLSGLFLSKKHKKTFEETKKRKCAEVKQKHKEKADYLLNNYLLKLVRSLEVRKYTIVWRNDIPLQRNDWDCGVFL